MRGFEDGEQGITDYEDLWRTVEVRSQMLRSEGLYHSRAVPASTTRHSSTSHSGFLESILTNSVLAPSH